MKNNVFEAADIWTKTRPFMTASFDAATGLEKDASNDWNIAADKSSVTCNIDGMCALVAHFDREYSNSDSEDL